LISAIAGPRQTKKDREKSGMHHDQAEKPLNTGRSDCLAHRLPALVKEAGVPRGLNCQFCWFQATRSSLARAKHCGTLGRRHSLKRLAENQVRKSEALATDLPVKILRFSVAVELFEWEDG
jgi:hypothetical protein